MTEIRIYAEGGGDRKDTKATIRRGFGSFFSELRDDASRRRVRWRIVAMGPRNAAFEGWQMARDSHPDAVNVLLVDAEEAVTSEAWEHLHIRDGWPLKSVDGDCCHLMVQVMESWLIADADALARYYGQGFQRSALPANNNVEQVDKAQVSSALGRATRRTQKGEYHKIRHGGELLGLVDAATVRRKAPSCERLFATLRDVIAKAV